MRGLIALALAAAMATAACGSDSTPTDTPTTPTPVTSTDTFSGTLNPNGGRTHTFITARSGTMTATLTSLGQEGLVVGLALGTFNGNACQIILRKDDAVQGSSIIGSGTQAGTFCVSIYDQGNLTDVVTYQIDVAHP
jgi:hypothetical protein